MPDYFFNSNDFSSIVLSLRKSRDEELIWNRMPKFMQSLVKAGRVRMGNASITEYVPIIREVSIENFKGIRHCEIKDIGKVNLFIGRNGCGKSSIMEAIYFTGREFLGTNLPQCIQRRANRDRWSARELWYNYLVGSELNVRLLFNERIFTEMNVRYLSKGGTAYVSLRSGSPKVDERETTNQYHVSNFALVSRASSPSLHSEQIRHYFIESVFVDPTIKTNIVRIEGDYLSIMKLSEENSSELAKRTSEIYNTEPSWEFLPHPDLRDNRFAILEGKRRLFLDNFGDGLHYGLAVLVMAKTRTNTALFIEEIESHQHPEAIGKLISNIVEIAAMNNLQLFITTHSRIVWSFLEKAFETEDARQRLLRVYRVARDGETGHVECIPQTKENADEFWSAVDKDLYGPIHNNQELGEEETI
jgi:predicted ATPase